MSSKGGGKQITGYRYFMAVHSGISRGPLNSLNEIRVGDIVLWDGNITESGFADINAPTAFGGDEKEGGVVGTFKMFMGEADQTIDSVIIDNIEGDNPVPSWRGTATLFYYGQISSNNPYPKNWKFRVRRTTKGWDNDDPWYPDKALIVLGDDAVVELAFLDIPKNGQYIVLNDVTVYFRDKPSDTEVRIGDTVEDTAQNFADAVNFYSEALGVSAVIVGNAVELRGDTDTPSVDTPYAFVTTLTSGGTIHAMNPAHIIYECATNSVWGRGLPRAMLDDDAFRAAADTLYGEGLGLCIRWTREDDIDVFVQSVINHIAGAIFIDRSTGLLTLKLIRNDYDATSLIAYTFKNGILDITEDQSSAADTMYNEVIVEFNDPVLDKTGQVRAQNLASFQSIGSIISQTVQYPGIATATLATRLAQRDLEMHSSEVRRFTLKFTRVASQFMPGGVIKLHVPERGIDNMVVRLAEINEDALTGESVEVKCVQDVFGMPDTAIIDPQESYWTAPDPTPRIITERRVTEMTYWDVAEYAPSTSIGDVQPGTGWIKVFARQPSSNAVQYDLQSQAEGEGGFVTRSTAAFDAAAELVGALGYYDTTIDYTKGSLISTVVTGELLLIDDEYMRIDAVDLTARTLTVARGVVDTIPQLHSSGAIVWMQTAMPGTDFRDYSFNETVYVRLLTRTSSQTLDPAHAEYDTIVIGARQGRPYPPGNVTVNGEPFGVMGHTITGNITLNWTHRDRIVQGNTLLAHQDGSTGPEPGTTYSIHVYGADQTTLYHTETGLAGTSWTYTTGNWTSDGSPPFMWFRLEAMRDGIASHQYYWFYVQRPPAGFDYGFDFNFDGGA